MKRQITILFVLILVILFSSWYVNRSLYGPQSNTLNQRPVEVAQHTCKSCHTEVHGLSPIHQAVTCNSCHLGILSAHLKKEAHQDMVLIPGQKSNWKQTCGTTACHADQVQRVEKSLMTTNTGIHKIDHALFTEAFANKGTSNKQIQLMADQHLKDKCSVCHLGVEKTEKGPFKEGFRGGGCLACHLSYDTPTQEKNGSTTSHPKLSIKVKNRSCFGCHNRSSRISTNFLGWHETNLEKIPVTSKSDHRRFSDQRVYKKVTADIHHNKGLSCTDCHTSSEVMGDGQKHTSQHDALKISCEDCHSLSSGTWLKYTELTDRDRQLVRLQALPFAKEEVLYRKTTGSTEALTNVVLQNQSVSLYEKESKKKHTLQRKKLSCQGQIDLHRNKVSCQACHTSWAPQCLSCHTQRDKSGLWNEWSGEFLSDLPSLGWIKGRAGDEIIEPFIPGMIQTISDQLLQADSPPIEVIQKNSPFLRLFSKTSPHTIAKTGRSCNSCHWSTLAIGVGRGELALRKNGTLYFTPEYTSLNDGLPSDAWVPLLSAPQKRTSLHQNQRPISPKEQKAILTVGACLSCHPWTKNQRLYTDFKASQNNQSASCVTPNFSSPPP